MTEKIKNIKKAIKKTNLPDPFFLSRYAAAPYQGCTHGCLYCDGRAEKYYVEGIFDKDITIRKNLPEIFAKELRLIREKCFLSLGSGTTDCYQPLEKNFCITQDVLKSLKDTRIPLIIDTKSDLLLRDIELIKEIDRVSGVVVAASVGTMDKRISGIMEPGASDIKDRIDMIHKLKKEGIAAGFLAMPILPGLSDDERSIKEIYETAREINADFLIPGWLTLRPGKQKELYLDSIKRYYPEQFDFIVKLYRENRLSGAPERNYSRNKAELFYKYERMYKIPYYIDHKIYREKVSLCDEIYILMSHMIDLYRNERIDIRPLKKSLEVYSNWLLAIRKDFNRKRSLPPDYPDLLLEEELKNRLSERIDNPKLVSFIREVVYGRRVFDYVELKLG